MGGRDGKDGEAFVRGFFGGAAEEEGVTLEQLCEGLCSISAITRFEKGERMPPKLLKDRILARLGESPGGYEQCLFRKEYIRWERRQRLINWLIKKDVEKARFEHKCDLLLFE